jgi:hypothetical protein
MFNFMSPFIPRGRPPPHGVSCSNMEYAENAISAKTYEVRLFMFPVATVQYNIANILSSFPDKIFSARFQSDSRDAFFLILKRTFSK